MHTGDDSGLNIHLQSVNIEPGNLDFKNPKCYLMLSSKILMCVLWRDSNSA